MRLRLALPVVVLALVGCGGGGDSDDVGPPQPRDRPGEAAALSKPEFVERADAICMEARAAVKRHEDAARAAARDEDAEAVADALNGTAEEADEQVDRLRAVTPPRGDEEIVDRYLTGIEDQIAVLRRAADAAERNDTSALNTLLQENQRASGEIRGLAQGYGFKECGSGE